ncbi:hypothetical protein BU24DRAFT_102897 [Aaosphaeria arxii CBS 175.79]|uniref:Uncharacterized protein n=1 Tax=Aaosphaeria arxii CBS 175.79 TaxID=1450172 RepID=A0A6A5Y0E4_9PLEO|nr:uncharacterized protein BU24DRAFT_102897 [Aaosphaeria arxii CBS 175.79]KAF2018696.1 hypothetical protein BU24DRAFT_102897 [Aaosphaeria arxii CBS 175.79]
MYVRTGRHCQLALRSSRNLGRLALSSPAIVPASFFSSSLFGVSSPYYLRMGTPYSKRYPHGHSGGFASAQAMIDRRAAFWQTGTHLDTPTLVIPNYCIFPPCAIIASGGRTPRTRRTRPIRGAPRTIGRVRLQQYEAIAVDVEEAQCLPIIAGSQQTKVDHLYSHVLPASSRSQLKKTCSHDNIIVYLVLPAQE